MGAKAKFERVPIAELCRRLSYDRETGVLRWRKGRQRIAGYLRLDGYREIEFRWNRHSMFLGAHRVAWAITTGEWPQNQIDHRDGMRDNNRFVNLREATAAENQQNRARSWHHTGLLGVTKTPRCKNRWRADMGGRYLGAFGTPEKAHQAYLAAKAAFHAFQPVPREL